MAAGLYASAKNNGQPFNAGEHGFEFSTADIEGYLARVQAANSARNFSKRDMPGHKSLANVA
ncbi:MAG: hypothetical protein ACJ74Z_16040 [Bryobacteraceae bacterium]